MTVITPLYKEYSRAVDDYFPFTVLRLRPLASSGRAAVLPQLLSCLKDYDVVNLHYPFFGSAELVALVKILHPSTRLKLHYYMDARSKGLKGLYFRLYARTVLPVLLRLADDITCSKLDYVESSDAAGYLKHHAEKFHEVPFGVDLDLFRPAAASLSSQPKTVLFVGALTRPGYFKGLENLMRAMKAISKEVDGCRLVVVGHGEMEPSYRNLAYDLRLGERVLFVTDADDQALVARYRGCDVLVLPPFNRNESFGIVLLEAMACGKPVIASDLPGVRAVFENGRQGLLVEPGNIDDLAEKIIAILTDEDMARRFGQAGRELVEKEYPWQEAGRRLDEIYRARDSKPRSKERPR